MHLHSIKGSLAALAFLVLSSSVVAHTAWLEPEDGQDNTYRLYFGGHANELEAYEAHKLKTVAVYDSEGRDVEFERSDSDNGIVLNTKRDPALFVVHFHNGIHARDPQGRSFNVPMSELPGATMATNTPKYHKFIVQWNDESIKAQGQEFEVIPLDVAPPQAGRAMRVKVVMDGMPVAGVALGHGEEGNEGVSNADGIAIFTPRPGLNRLWAGKRFQVSDNEDYTELSYEYLLGFYAQ